MSQLLEYLTHHPGLAGGALVLAILVIVNEIRERAQAFAAVSAAQAVLLMNQGALVLDVRDKAAYEAGHVGEARNCPLAELENQADSLKRWREKNVIVYCERGVTAASAVRTLTRLGFAKVFNLAGGIEAWRRDNLPVVRGGANGGSRK